MYHRRKIFQVAGFEEGSVHPLRWPRSAWETESHEKKKKVEWYVFLYCLQILCGYRHFATSIDDLINLSSDGTFLDNIYILMETNQLFVLLLKFYTSSVIFHGNPHYKWSEFWSEGSLCFLLAEGLNILHRYSFMHLLSFQGFFGRVYITNILASSLNNMTLCQEYTRDDAGTPVYSSVCTSTQSTVHSVGRNSWFPVEKLRLEDIPIVC